MSTFVAILLFFFGLDALVTGVKNSVMGDAGSALPSYVFAGLAIWAGVWVTAL